MNKFAFILAVLLGAVAIVIFLTLISNKTYDERRVDEGTRVQCRIYADRDHEKEFAPERWEKNKEWIQKFDWYGSCIDHVRYPVAK